MAGGVKKADQELHCRVSEEDRSTIASGSSRDTFCDDRWRKGRARLLMMTVYCEKNRLVDWKFICPIADGFRISEKKYSALVKEAIGSCNSVYFPVK